MAEDKRPAGLERRIAALESALVDERARGVRRRRTGWALVLGFCALGAATQKFPLVVTTRRLEIVDDAGRVVLAASAESGGALELFDAAGQAVAALRAGPKDGGLHLFDAGGRPLASLTTSPQGGIARFYHQAGKIVAMTGALAQGGALVLSDAEGGRAVELGASPDGGSARLNHAGQTRLALSGAASGSRAEFHATHEQPAVRISATADTSRVSMIGRDENGAWPAFDVAAKADATEWTLGAPGKSSALRARAESTGTWLAIEREAVTSFRVESLGSRVGLWLMDLAGQEIFGVASGRGVPYEEAPAGRAPEPRPLTEEADDARKFAEHRAGLVKQRIQSWEPTDPALLKDKAAMARLRAKLEGLPVGPAAGQKPAPDGKRADGAKGKRAPGAQGKNPRAGKKNPNPPGRKRGTSNGR